jgi:hypothetical protein
VFTIVWLPHFHLLLVSALQSLWLLAAYHHTSSSPIFSEEFCHIADEVVYDEQTLQRGELTQRLLFNQMQTARIEGEPLFPIVVKVLRDVKSYCEGRVVTSPDISRGWRHILLSVVVEQIPMESSQTE